MRIVRLKKIEVKMRCVMEQNHRASPDLHPIDLAESRRVREFQAVQNNTWPTNDRIYGVFVCNLLML